MKKIILAMIVCFLVGCQMFKNHDIIDMIEVDSDSCKIVYDKDTHGGFLGDGDYFARIKCKEITKDNLSKNWKELPLSKSLTEFTSILQCNDKGCADFYQKYDIPNIESGYYYFYDRHTDAYNRFDDTDLNNRASNNFTLAIFDNDNDMIYYYEFDS